MNKSVQIDEAAARLCIVQRMRQLWQRGLIAAGDGNASMRLNAERILITPSGLLKSELVPEQLVVIDLHGQMLEGDHAPSSEWPMHLAIYAQRPEIHAILHAHPPTAVALSIAGFAILDNMLPEVNIYLGRIPTVPYARPGSKQLSEAVATHARQSQALLLERHGAITYGSRLDEAYGYMEVVEHAAKVMFMAQQLGGATALQGEELAELQKISIKADSEA